MRRIACLVLLLAACQSTQDQGAKRLLNSSSPYLRNHADNPVHWYEWGNEAFERAADEDKPVIVSIGYSACHWCHVMERECFMDPEVAKIMNEKFISIKVDREERPDIDIEYVHASEMLTGNAGWPLNAFALPDGKPFHTITYYPKDAFIELLNKVSKSWADDRPNLERQARMLKENMTQVYAYPMFYDTTLRLDLKTFINNAPAWQTQLDFKNGGIKGMNKFPMPSLIRFMMQHSYLTGDAKSKTWVETTLTSLARGGIYDHVGGGFSRYSVDSLWQVPHFEKMLYDNAQLISVYADAYKMTKNDMYKNVIQETIKFLETEMQTPQGGFYSTTNADSEDEEGKFFFWSKEEFRTALGPEAEEAIKYFNVTDGDKNVLRTSGTSAKAAAWKQKLKAHRDKRERPTIDKKMIVSWNAMMVVAYLDAYAALNEKEYLASAIKNTTLFDPVVFSEVGVYRSMLDNKIGGQGFLEDYAWVAKAYIQLYQTTLDIKWLNFAKKVVDQALVKFKGDDVFYFYSEKDDRTNVPRNVELFDTAMPSSNSVFAEVLFILGEYFQNEDYMDRAVKAVEQAVSPIDVDGLYIGNWARLGQAINAGHFEIATTGSKALEFTHELQSKYLPTAIFLGGTVENLPLLENKLMENKTMIYVCRNRTCKLPVEDPQAALRQIVIK